MTCIVGYEHNGKVYIAGDSLSSNSSHGTVMTVPKVFQRGEMIFGYTSTWRFGQLLQFVFDHPPRYEGLSDLEYLITAWIPALATMLETNRHLEKETNGFAGCGYAIIGYRGNVYFLNGDLSLLHPKDGYYAVGCGDEFARGAMHVLTQGNVKNPEDVVRKAIEAAAHHSVGVGGDIHIISL